MFDNGLSMVFRGRSFLFLMSSRVILFFKIWVVLVIVMNEKKFVVELRLYFFVFVLIFRCCNVISRIGLGKIIKILSKVVLEV